MIYTYQYCRNASGIFPEIRLNIFLNEQEEIVGIYYAHKPIRGRAFQDLFQDTTLPPHPKAAHLLIGKELDWYFQGKISSFTSPYKIIAGTTFQKSVWHALSNLSLYQCCTYGDIAHVLIDRLTPQDSNVSNAEKKSSANMYARAVGTAVGTNPISIVIPCHRVLPAQHIAHYAQHNILLSHIGNYGGGKEMKHALLLHEHTIHKSKNINRTI